MADAANAMPYAPPATVMAVVQRHRQVAIPHFDVSTLQRIGVSDSLAPRTLQALKLLDLVDDDGKPTEPFEKLRKAPTAEFEAVLGDILRDAYAPVFAILDPAAASAEDVEDAFRHFVPSGQRTRMVTLFTGLLREAGLIGDLVKKEGGPRRPQSSRPRPVVKKQTTATGGDETSDTAAVEVERTSAPPSRYGEGDTYRVQLKSGGSVSIVMDVNLFLMSTDDREFVIDLVDRMKGYDPGFIGDAPVKVSDGEGAAMES